MDDRVVVELKACQCIAPLHVVQTLSYLKSTRLRLALLINFDVAVLQRGIKRIIHTHENLGGFGTACGAIDFPY